MTTIVNKSKVADVSAVEAGDNNPKEPQTSSNHMATSVNDSHNIYEDGGEL